MTPSQLNHHDANNKIATLDACLSALRIYLKRNKTADEADAQHKALLQCHDITVDMLSATQALQGLIEQCIGAEERT